MAETQDKTQEEGTPSPEEQREQAREAQNLPEGAVPEQRPQASQTNEGTVTESDLTKQLREAGDPAVAPDEPMDQAAYDRAASDSQMKKAAKDSKSEGPMVGSVVIVKDGPHKDRVFAVTRVLQDGSVGDAIRRLSGDPTQVLNSPKEIEGRAIGDERDGELVILNLEENEVEKVNEAWRGTRAGRRH